MKKLADKRKKYILECIAFCVVVGLDQLTKKLAEIHLMHTDTFPILEGVLHLTYVENTGASFGILKNHRWIFLVFSSIAILGILIFLFLKYLIL